MCDEKRKTLYFAHPEGTYGTRAEESAIRCIKKLFPHHDIINPSSPLYQPLLQRRAGYENQLVMDSDCLVYIPFGDGKIDSRTANNIRKMLIKQGEMHELHVTEQGMPNGMCSNITALHGERVLTTEESSEHNQAAAQAFQRPQPTRR